MISHFKNFTSNSEYFYVIKIHTKRMHNEYIGLYNPQDGMEGKSTLV